MPVRKGSRMKDFDNTSGRTSCCAQQQWCEALRIKVKLTTEFLKFVILDPIQIHTSNSVSATHERQLNFNLLFIAYKNSFYQKNSIKKEDLRPKKKRFLQVIIKTTALSSLSIESDRKRA